MTRAARLRPLQIDIAARVDEDPWRDEDLWGAMTAPLSTGPAEGHPFCISFKLDAHRGEVKLQSGAYGWSLRNGYALCDTLGAESRELTAALGASALSAFGSFDVMYAFEHHLSATLDASRTESYHACLCKHGLLIISTDVLATRKNLSPQEALIAIVPEEHSAHLALIRKQCLDACANAVLSRQNRVPFAGITGGVNINLLAGADQREDAPCALMKEGAA